MSGQTHVNIERSGFWILACCEHDINEVFLFFEVISVIDNSIIDDLSNEADWRLGSIFIKIWHVKIIHEIDENLAWWWTKGSSGSLVNLGFNNDLKSFGVSVVVEVDSGAKGFLFIKSGEVILNVGGLTSTSRTDVEDTSSGTDMEIKKKSLSGSFSSWNNHVLEKTFIGFVESGSDFIPMDPTSFHWVIEEIKALTNIWELNFGHSFPLVGEGKLILIKRGTVSPHSSEDEESFIDSFDLIFFVIFSISLHHVMKCFYL